MCKPASRRLPTRYAMPCPIRKNAHFALPFPSEYLLSVISCRLPFTAFSLKTSSAHSESPQPHPAFGFRRCRHLACCRTSNNRLRRNCIATGGSRGFRCDERLYEILAAILLTLCRAHTFLRAIFAFTFLLRVLERPRICSVATLLRTRGGEVHASAALGEFNDFLFMVLCFCG